MQNLAPRESQRRSSGSASVGPPARPCERLGARGQKPRRPPLHRQYWMVCQYSRCGHVSSEKHKTASKAGAEEEGDHSGVVTVTVVMGGYWTRSDSLRSEPYG